MPVSGKEDWYIRSQIATSNHIPQSHDNLAGDDPAERTAWKGVGPVTGKIATHLQATRYIFLLYEVL